MQASLLEILRSIPDHRRAEGKRFDLSTVLLYTILAMVAGANSYRQMHEFIRTHLQRLNEALPPGATAIAVDGKTLRGSFDAFNDRKAAHMMSALRHADQIVLAHVMVAEKSNEIPTAPELIEALGLKGRLFTLDAEHCQKNCSNA